LIANTITAMARDLSGCGADAPRLARFVRWRRLAKDTLPT
jgi:hypothetical protein